jgi:hypothetical protein
MNPVGGRRRNQVPPPSTDTRVVLVRGNAEIARWALGGPGRPDLGVVDRLARLQLAARRLGCSIRLEAPCAELAELLVLAGLDEIVVVTDLRQVGGEPERGEQVGVQEVVMPDDPVA